MKESMIKLEINDKDWLVSFDYISEVKIASGSAFTVDLRIPEGSSEEFFINAREADWTVFVFINNRKIKCELMAWSTLKGDGIISVDFIVC